jgi:hypothetical protein
MPTDDTLMKIEGHRIPAYHKVMISNRIGISCGDGQLPGTQWRSHKLIGAQAILTMQNI